MLRVPAKAALVISFTLAFLDVREGATGEGEGKVGSHHSAAVSSKKQLVRRTEAAAGCDTWIRTSLVIDCTAVLSLSLYSPFLLQIRLIFTLYLCGMDMEVRMNRRERSLCTSKAIL